MKNEKNTFGALRNKNAGSKFHKKNWCEIPREKKHSQRSSNVVRLATEVVLDVYRGLAEFPGEEHVLRSGGWLINADRTSQTDVNMGKNRYYLIRGSVL